MSNHETAWQGAGNNRLMGQAWHIMPRDPNDDVAMEAMPLAVRAWDLVRNDPVMGALRNAKLVGTHGSRGLRLRSLYQADGSEAVSDEEIKVRQAIEAEIHDASCGAQLDASGIYTRLEFERALDELATVSGEAFAIRMFLPNRPGAATATCWRIIRPERVSNPPGQVDGVKLFQGLELDDNGQIIAIHIGPPRRLRTASALPAPSEWIRVPWYAPDGSRNVIHRIGTRLPGSYRAVSMFAQLIPMAKQVKGCIDAYVIAKRIQACHPIFIKCEDPNAAAKKDRNGAVWGPNTALEPGKTYYVGKDAEIVMPTFQFQGADLREFLDTLYRNEFASWGMPIDVVLAQLGETNMAASRSAWSQYYRQCDIWQDEHIEQVSRVLDESIIREAVARKRLTFPKGMPWSKIMANRYIRPPRAMPDPKKEAEAVQLWATLGRDLTGLWAESGVDYRESIIQRADDNAFAAEHEVEVSPPEPAPFGAPAEGDPAAEPTAPTEPEPKPEEKE